MGKIYTSMTDFERAMEDEFREKVESIAYYQGNIKRTTLDNEWTDEELDGILYDEVLKILNGEDGSKGWLEKNKYKAIKDNTLTKPEFIVNDIKDRYDLIEVYNRAYDMHRNDEKRLFGIQYFIDLCKDEINKILRNNLVNK